MRKMLAVTTVVLWSTWLGIAPCQAGSGPKKSANRKILYAPTGYQGIDILVHKNKEYKYYLFSIPGPLELEVEGPTTLTLKMRLLCEPSDKGGQAFRFIIQDKKLLDGTSEVFLKKTFLTEKSRRSYLKGNSGLTPSKGKTVKFPVPAGHHHYWLFLEAQVHQGGMRILIPKKDLIQKKRRN